MNGENNFVKIVQILKSIRLTAKEKEEGLMKLRRFMSERSATPVFASVSKRGGFRWWLSPGRLVPSFLSLALVVSTSVALAANGAMPGDALFPIKTSINENLMTIFAGSGAAKAKVNTTLAKRRLEEMEIMAAADCLDAHAKDEAVSDFNNRAQAVKTFIEENKSSGQAAQMIEISSDLESSLKAHEAILDALSTGKDQDIIGAVVEAVHSHKTEITHGRQEAENNLLTGGNTQDPAQTKEVSLSARSPGSPKPSVSLSPSPSAENNTSEIKHAAEEKKISAQGKIGEVEKTLGDSRTNLGDNAITQTLDHLDSARSAFDNGVQKLNSQSYSEAFILFQKAHRLTQESKILMEAVKEYKIDARDKGDESDD